MKGPAGALAVFFYWDQGVNLIVSGPPEIRAYKCRGEEGLYVKSLRLVAYSKDDRTRFNNHMNIEHGISHSLSFILAGCLMNEEEREAVANIIEEREEKINSIVTDVDVDGGRPEHSDNSSPLR